MLGAALGLDLQSLVLSQPNDGEAGLAIADELVRSGCFAAVVVDSVAALIPRRVSGPPCAS